KAGPLSAVCGHGVDARDRGHVYRGSRLPLGAFWCGVDREGRQNPVDGIGGQPALANRVDFAGDDHRSYRHCVLSSLREEGWCAAADGLKLCTLDLPMMERFILRISFRSS